jgi:hypothetical protein
VKDDHTMKTKLLFLTFLCTGLLCGNLLAAAPPVQVKMSKEVRPGSVTYRYRVVNNSTRPIVELYVGRDYYHGAMELTEMPIGWDFHTGTPSTSAAAPAGWSYLLSVEEEGDFHWFSWSTSTDPIAPNGSKSGFSVTVPRADPMYETGHWTVHYADSITDSGVIQQDDNAPPPDTLPPVLSVTISPDSIWPPNRKMITVSATVTATDNVDPHPAVRLVSITSNEALDANDVAGATLGTDDREFQVRAWRAGAQKEGREYRVTYSATDAAGNRATVTTIVRVPHDERH